MKFETEKENDPYFLTQKIVCGCEIHIVVVAVDVDIDLDVDRLRFIDRGVSGFKPIIGASRRCKGLHLVAATILSSSLEFVSVSSMKVSYFYETFDVHYDF